MSSLSRETKRRKVKLRASSPPDSEECCVALGCGQPTQRATGNGLSDTYCKKHKEMKRRHGVTWRKSYTAAELKPYLNAARKWLKQHRQLPRVVFTLKCLEVFLADQGEVADAREVRWLKPKLKAKSTLAKFRESKSERELLIIALALEAITQDVGPSGADWRHMQIAKCVHRVKAKVFPTSSGGVRFKLKHLRAEGKGMRLVGEWVRKEARAFDLEEAVEDVIKAVNAG